MDTDDADERIRLHSLADDARTHARQENPYMYGQDKIMDAMNENVNTGMSYINAYNEYPGYLQDPYTWFVAMEFLVWNYKFDDDWRIPSSYADKGLFDGQNLNVGHARNWMSWIYFDGQLWGADKFSNMNMGYVGTKMGFTSNQLLTFETTDDQGDIDAINYGINMANKRR